MTTETFIERAKNCIVEVTDVNINKKITTDDVYEVWCFNGVNSDTTNVTCTAFLSTTLRDGMYYRATITEPSPLIRRDPLSINIDPYKSLSIRIDQFKKISNECIYHRYSESFPKTVESALFMEDCISGINLYLYNCGCDYKDISINCLCHSKILHHHKAIFSLSKSVNGDTLLFEITYNGLKREKYIDVYIQCDTSYVF